MTSDLVSVVVPVYKVEKYLDRCISSIVNQSYRNLEIIMVDDGSPDQCPQMCDAWAKRDHRIKVIHKKNAGAGYARNSGMEIATGKYICFFDSDDYVAPDAVEKAYKLARKENVEIVIYGSATVDDNDNVVKLVVPQSENYCYRGESVRTVLLPDLIDGNHDGAKVNNLCLSLWSCMFSMETIRQNNWRLVSERDFASEDSYSIITLYNNVNSVAILPKVLYYYRETDGSLSHTYKRDAHERLKVFYRKCIQLSNGLGHSDEVCRRIAGLYLSQEIELMKQIVLAEFGVREEFNQIKEIVADDITQEAIGSIHWHYHSQARNLLIWTIQKRLFHVAYLLVKGQILKSIFTKYFWKWKKKDNNQ